MINFLFSLKNNLSFILLVSFLSFSVGAKGSTSKNLKGFIEEKNLKIPGRILSFTGYRGELYFLNESEGNIWRLDQNLMLGNKIGKKGEGPGEIPYLSNFNFLDGKIYLFSRGRLLEFRLDGGLISERKFPCKDFCLFLRNGNVVERERNFSRERGKKIIEKVSFLDKNANELVEVLKEELQITPGYEFEAIEPRADLKYSEKNGFVYISNPVREFLIMIYDENGKQIGKITRNYKKIKVGKEFIEKFSQTVIQDPRITSKEMAKEILKQIHFPKYFPPFHRFYLDDEGNVFVRTFKRKFNKAVFEKYSPRGNFLREYYLEDRNINIVDAHLFISFTGGKYYYLYENEKGDYILHCEKLK